MKIVTMKILPENSFLRIAGRSCFGILKIESSMKKYENSDYENTS